MLPLKKDPRWKEVVIDENIPNFSALPTKMMMMRVRLLAKDKTPQKIQEAIDIAFDFFSKNAMILQYDIDLLFNERKEKK